MMARDDDLFALIRQRYAELQKVPYKSQEYERLMKEIRTLADELERMRK